ncbi:hypothetical protein HanIR_Chr17g0870471 [Helianthus annuus]|nr:hypothetical protein HanIR_Chr17g0870471 [Helianthus annuus]
MNQITRRIKCVQIMDTGMNLRTCNKVDTVLRMHLLMNHITRRSNRIRVMGYTGMKVDTEVTVDTVVMVDTGVKVVTVDMGATVDTIDMGVTVVTVDTGVKVVTVYTIDLGMKLDTVDTKNMVDMVMSPVTHHFMNHLPRAIHFK